MKISKAWRIIALVVALALLVGSVFLIRSCSAPPKLEEVETRLKQLIEDAYGVNVIFFGEGLPTYERIYDPLDSLEIYKTGELYIEDGEEKERRVWYYFPTDEKNKIVAFRDSYLVDFAYAYVSEGEQTEESLKALFPAVEGVNAPEGKSFYSSVYTSEDGKEHCYLVPYAEKKADFYYNSTDPADYDYVRSDADYLSIAQIKEYAESVYSRNYLLSLYGSVFDGVASGGTVLKARYTEQFNDDGTSARLALLNTEKPLFTEKRVYLYDTAKIIFGSSNKFLRITIDTYLPSAPEKIVEQEVNLVLQDGIWYLDNPTF